MAAAADGNLQPPIAGEPQRGKDIGGTGATGDQRGAVANRSVPDRADLFVAIISRAMQRTGKKYFIYPDDDHRIPLRYDLFGFANWTGLVAGLVLVLLLAISNDASLRALGTRRWKAWQRWTYWAAALTVAHALAYQVPTKNHGRWIAAFMLLTIIVLVMQLDGRRRMLARRDSRATAPG